MSLSVLINPKSNDDWIQFIGKYMINMGAIEATSRMIIAKLNKTELVDIFSADLSPRLLYLRTRYPNNDKKQHQKAMRLFDVLLKHVVFRNIVAHSGIIYQDSTEGVPVIVGLLNFKPNDSNNIAEYISIEEMKGRVDESGKSGAALLELQNDFTLEKTTHKES